MRRVTSLAWLCLGAALANGCHRSPFELGEDAAGAGPIAQGGTGGVPEDIGGGGPGLVDSENGTPPFRPVPIPIGGARNEGPDDNLERVNDSMLAPQRSIARDAGPLPDASPATADAAATDPSPDQICQSNPGSLSLEDTDRDGVADICAPCSPLSDLDSDGDGVPDECDNCGLGVALRYNPMHLFAFDEAPGQNAVANHGRSSLDATVIGAVQTGVNGVADTQRRAVLLEPPNNRPYPRIAMAAVDLWPTSELTAILWLRTSQTSDHCILSYATDDSDREFEAIVRGGGTFEGNVRVSAAGATYRVATRAGTPDLNDGNWHSLAIAWDRTQVRVYADGQPYGEAFADAAGPDGTATRELLQGGDFVLGQDQVLLNGLFQEQFAYVGAMDEVSIYPQALSEEQIADIFRATTCGEVCNGIDDDRDGLVDEGFLGATPSCPAPTCESIAATQSDHGTGTYFLQSDPNLPRVCTFL